MEDRKVYDEGRSAYWAGKTWRDNPYPRDSTEYQEWDKGHVAAMCEDEE